MATTTDRLLVDTSVLLEASNRARAHHAAARALLEKHAGLVFPAQVLREYLVVATRAPEQNGLGLKLAQALENVEGFRERIRLLPEERPLLPAFLALLKETPVSGKRLHDAHIAAAAICHRVGRIVTLNTRDFAPFADHLTCVLPGQA